MICSRGIWDSTVPGIKFDDKGISNYSKIFNTLLEYYPRGEQGIKDWDEIVKKAKRSGYKKDYDCIIGVSGGTDSSYLLHLLVKKYNLRPLAITVDNGWSSDISVSNIKLMTEKLGVDLETYVIDYEEMKDILKSFMKAGLPWVDGPTDHAIRAVLHMTAKKEGIKFVFHGSDFRSEGNQPNEWTHCDSKQIKFIQNKFGTKQIKSFPCLSLIHEIYSGFIRKVKLYRPFYFLPYKKIQAQKFLAKEYGWQYYGGHHHENSFTKFAIADWLPNKFGIDKRIITLSALVMSGEISREKALEEIRQPAVNKQKMYNDRDFVCKKLGLTKSEFEQIWNSPNKTFHDYPSYYPITQKLKGLINILSKYILPYKPLSLIQDEIRNSGE